MVDPQEETFALLTSKLGSVQAAHREVQEAAEAGISLLPKSHPHFPPAFRELADCPLLIYVQGSIPSGGIGIVGTRNCTPYGAGAAESSALGLSKSGISVISGLARGIDTAAHRGSLAHGKTVAIIGSGLLEIYPRENLSLSREIVKKGGAIISEYPLHTPPHAYHFPERNRLIAALSESLLLIEVPLKSGAMITAERALALGKKCYALPGRADMESFRGSHKLIREGRATLFESVAEIVGVQKNLAQEEDPFLQHLKGGEFSLDELTAKTNLSLSELSVRLMRLVLNGAIVELPGKYYKVVPR